ncbi:kelch repeat-containing protein [Cystobacter fuscus]
MRWSNLYDPATNTWSASEDIGSKRAYHTATLLPSGQVLVVGFSEAGMLYTP